MNEIQRGIFRRVSIWSGKLEECGAKNSPAKNVPSEEFSGEEYTDEECSDEEYSDEELF
jgi:hypothetical protein